MRKLRTFPLPHKASRLPAGVSCTWRKRPGKRPYFEFQVLWADDKGHPKIKHFYVGVEPTPIRRKLMRLKAIAFRKAYEMRRRPIHVPSP